MQKTVCAFVLIAACAAILAPAWAAGGPTTYYVSPKGQDANDGQSVAKPWKTLAMVRSRKFNPGDTILFERDGVWRESLVAGSSGTPDDPITYDAYGLGAKPVFMGSDVLANANFVPAGPNSYTYNIPNLPAGQIFVLVDHQFLGNGPAAYNSPTLTISSPTNPKTDGKLYTVCTRGNVITSNSQRNLVFRNLVVDETAGQINEGAVQGYGVRVEGSVNVLIEDCDALRCGRHNFASINSDQITFRGCNAAYVAPQINAGNTLYVTYCDTGAASKTSCVAVYEACTGSGGVFYTEHNNGGPVPKSTFTDKRSDFASRKTNTAALAGPGPYKKLAALAAQISTGTGYGSILKTLAKKKESQDAEEAAEAKMMYDALHSGGQASLDAALAYKDSKPALVVSRLEQLAAQFAGDEIGTNAKQAAEQLRKDPRVAKELEADAMLTKLEAFKDAFKPAGGARDPKSAAFRKQNAQDIQTLVGGCQELLRRYPKTAAAAKAEALMSDYR